MEALYLRICVFLGLFADVVIAVLLFRRPLADFHEFVRRTPKWQRAFLALLAAGFIVYGSTKTNQVDQVKARGEGEQLNLPICSAGRAEGTNLLCSPSPLAFTSTPPTVNSVEITRGWQLVGVDTNAAVDYAMPEGAVLASNWWVRGAYEDVSRIELNPTETALHPAPSTSHQTWRFPFGTNEYSSLWAFSWGKLRFRFDDTNEIAAVGSPMSAVPYRSRLWTFETNGVFLVTWENFALNRDTDTLVNAQIELKTTGDFVVRSNEVETLCRRVDPEDWDADGWRNDDDPDPYVWEEYGDSFWQELPDGANESAYCWIEIRPRWHSYIEFYGDGPSDLDDPYLWAKAGETYRIQLLIGKTYFIESTQPVEVVGLSSSSIEIDGNGTSEIEVVWPVTMSALESNGRGFRMVVRPSGLGGLFHWTDSCCTIYGTGLVYRYGCGGDCGCSGCYAQGHYEYEGYRLSATGGWCGCSSDHGVDHDPQSDPYSVGASISFTKQAIIFEDEYANTTNDIVPWRSTETELVCSAYGGGNGGYARFDISGGDGLIQYTGRTLPYARNLAPNERICFTNRYRAVTASSREDEIEATSYFSENVTGWTESGETYATAVKVELQPLTFAPENECAFRHKLGVGENVECRHFPTVSQIEWRATGAGSVVGRNGRVVYVSAMHAERDGLKVSGCGAEFTPSITVVEPTGVRALNADYRTMGLGAGQAGGILLTMTLHVLPMDVSFIGAAVEEVPDGEGRHSGYFADMFFMNEWYHGTGQNAGVWTTVFGRNQFLSDEAGFQGELPQLDEHGTVSEQGTCGWACGELAWQVLCGWGEPNSEQGDEPEGVFATGAWQIMTIDAGGNCSVQKHANSVSRLITGHILFNGVLVE